jgi:ankyrin repeat protein
MGYLATNLAHDCESLQKTNPYQVKMKTFLTLALFLLSFNVHAQNEKKSSLELIAAIKRGDIVVAKKLLDEGANPNSTSSVGTETAINIAITRTDVPMTELLLNMKASPEALNSNPFSPLTWVASTGGGTGRKILIIRALVKAGADLNKVDTMGRTFLVQVTNENIYNVPVIDEVIRLGGDPTITNAKGATAIDIAIEHNMPATTIEYMKNYKVHQGKPMPQFGNTEGMCRVVTVKNEKDPGGLKGLFFTIDKNGCDAKNLANGVNGIFTKYDGTECSGTWKVGVLMNGECKVGY